MPSRAVLSKHVGALVGLLLSLIALGPVLAHRGYVLIGDMVFLPRPPLSRSLLGLSAATPRAVPSDLVAAVAGHLLPGDIAQKLLLAGVFVVAAAGGARLLAGCSLTARVPAAVFLAWNPYVAERLALGQWAVLLGYSALPWVLVAAARLRAGNQAAWSALIVSLAVAALTPTGGLVATAAALLVLLCGRTPAWRAAGLLVAVAALANAPWLLPALLRPTALAATPAGISAFAARADTPLGILGSLATLGGIWSSDAVPPGRAAAGLVPALLLLLVGVVVGTVLMLRGRAPLWSQGPAYGLLLSAVLGLFVAAAGACPGLRDLLRDLVVRLPPVGLLRDGPRHLGPLAVLEALALGLSADALARQLPTARKAFAVLAAAVPVLLLPGMANGVSGRLVPVDYPPGWAAARRVVAADPVRGSVLALPWSAYRAPPWNGRRTVLDPAGKAFARRVVADDRLRVGSQVVPGEDPLAARLTALATGTGPLVAAASAAGVRWVLVERDSAAARRVDLRLAGADLVVDTPALALWRLPAPVRSREPTPPVVPVVVADGAALVVLLGAGAVWLRSARRQ